MVMNHHAARPRSGDREQAVVAQDDGLRSPSAWAMRFPSSVSSTTREVVEQRMVLVEGADVLVMVRAVCPWRPGLAVDRMGVGGGDHVGPGRVDLRVDGEGGGVDWLVALDDVAQMVHADERETLTWPKWHAEGVHPEAVAVLGSLAVMWPPHPRRSRTWRRGERAAASRCLR